jgi:hypothetical protein
MKARAALAAFGRAWVACCLSVRTIGSWAARCLGRARLSRRPRRELKRVATCTHLDQIRVERPQKVGGCEECLKNGAAAAGHPIANSVEPGEDWSWCYIDEVAFVF